MIDTCLTKGDIITLYRSYAQQYKTLSQGSGRLLEVF